MSLRAADLIAFLEALPDSGFEASHQQYLAAHKLMAALAERNEWPREEIEWRGLLAPVLCSTPAQQEDFYRRFGDWRGAGQAKTVERTTREIKRSRNESTPALQWACALAILYSLAFGVYKWQMRHPRPLPPIVNSGGSAATPGAAPTQTSSLSGVVFDDDNDPIAGATVWYQGKQSTADARGGFVLNVTRNPSGFAVLVTHERYSPALEKVGLATPNLQVNLHPRKSDLPASWPLAHFEAIRRTAVLLPAASLLAWWLWARRRRLQLKKWETALQPQVRRIGIQGGAAIFGAARIRKLALELRRRKPRASIELAPEATVEATAARAGYFTPVFMAHQAQPEYLVLGERISPRDQQARFHDELLMALQAQGVYLDRYYFQSDPRVCRAVKDRKSSFALRDLAAVHPYHSLWLWCDATKLLDPATGEPWQWVNTLSAWQDRAILTPRTEKPLAGLDFKMARPNPDGILQLCDSASEARSKGLEVAYPPLLLDQPERWIEREPPPPALIARLSAELRQYLGVSGYPCLSACAVYPGLAWNLTLCMAREMLPSAELESTTERLVRLPWFRYGTMPDWLRIKLLVGLPRAQERKIRAALESYLDRSKRDAREGDAIELANRTGARAPDSGPLQDFVFLSFLWGRKMDALAVHAPNRWMRLLFEHGDIAFGLRPLAALLLAAGLAAGAWFGLGAAKRWIEPPPKTRLVAQSNLLLARAVDVAESQIGNSWGSSYAFMFWCFLNASDVLGVRNPVGADSAGSAWPSDFTSKGVIGNRSLLQPGDMFISNNSTGLVESIDVYGNFDAIEVDEAKRLAVRKSRFIPDADYSFIDWSKRIPKPDNPGNLPLTVGAAAALAVQIQRCSTLDGHKFDCIVEVENRGSGATRNLQYKAYVSGSLTSQESFELQPAERRTIAFHYSAELPQDRVLEVRVGADNATTVSVRYPFEVKPNKPLQAGASGDVAIPLIDSAWVGPSQINTPCNPSNPREAAFEQVRTPPGLGVKMSSAASAVECCNCTRRGTAFTLAKPMEPYGNLTGWFEAIRGATDTYSLASFQIELYRSKQLLGSQTFAAEHRPNNNCVGKPGSEILLQSGAPFSVPLTSIAGAAFDEIRIYLQGYGCGPSTNSVTLSNLKIVSSPPQQQQAR